LDHGVTVARGTAREILMQAELLREHGLVLPEAADIACRLRAGGVPIAGDLLTPGEVEEALWQVLPH
jgi:hypothetical protein